MAVRTTLPPGQTPGPTGDTRIQNAPNNRTLTSSQQSAWAQLQQTLESYGFRGGDLVQLARWARDEIIKGNSAPQIALDLMKTPEFERRFPAIGVLSQEGVAITPAEYISLEQSYAQAEHAVGLPPDFHDYDALIAGQVSPSEFAQRLNQVYVAVKNNIPEVKEEWDRFYGAGTLLGVVLDPKRGAQVLMQRAQAAEIAGAAKQAGFHPGGEISQAEALRLAQQGVTFQQAQQGFNKLTQEKQLYSNLPGQGQRYNFNTGNLTQAQFGTDGQTALQLQIQADYEKNTTNQGVGVQQTQQGQQGIGSVQR